MKLSEMGLDVVIQATDKAGTEEEKALFLLMEQLPPELSDLYRRIDETQSALLVAKTEAAFLAGLKMGRNPLAWLVEGQADKP